VIRIIIILLALSGAFAASAQESIISDASPDYVEKLVVLARENYPKFKWTAAKTDIARINISKAKLSWFDFLQVSYGYTPGYTRTDNNVTPYYSPSQVGIFMNVGNLLQKPAAVRIARAEYTVAGLDKQVVDLNVETMVRQRYYTYLKHLGILKLRTGMQSDASDQLKGLKYKFERGQVTFETYNQAQLAYSSQVQEKITAESDMLISRSSVEELIGTKLENIR
jgi:outer membrane protein TolC